MLAGGFLQPLSIDESKVNHKQIAIIEPNESIWRLVRTTTSPFPGNLIASLSLKSFIERKES